MQGDRIPIDPGIGFGGGHHSRNHHQYRPEHCPCGASDWKNPHPSERNQGKGERENETGFPWVMKFCSENRLRNQHAILEKRST